MAPAFSMPEREDLMLHYATEYTGGSVNADGSSYSTYHAACRALYGKRINVSWVDPRTGRRHWLRDMPVSDKTAKRYANRIDLTVREYRTLFGSRGLYLQPKGGYPVQVTLSQKTPCRRHQK